MASSMKSHECEITVVLDFPNLSAITAELQILECHFIVSLLPRPFEGLGPSLVSKPVANKVRIALDQGLVPAESNDIWCIRNLQRKSVWASFQESLAPSGEKASSSPQQTKSYD